MGRRFRRFHGVELLKHRKPLRYSLPYLFALRFAGLYDVFQTDLRSGEFMANRPAQKAIPIKDPNNRKVAWVVPDGDILADIGGQIRIEVTLPLKMYAVLLHPPLFCNVHEQQIQLF